VGIEHLMDDIRRHHARHQAGTQKVRKPGTWAQTHLGSCREHASGEATEGQDNSQLTVLS